MPQLTGWRYATLIGSLVGLIGVVFYPIAIDPYLNPDKWKKIQNETRKGIQQEEIQPGGMKVWSDPFDRPKQN